MKRRSVQHPPLPSTPMSIKRVCGCPRAGSCTLAKPSTYRTRTHRTLNTAFRAAGSRRPAKNLDEKSMLRSPSSGKRSMLRSPKRELRETAFRFRKTHYLGSRLGPSGFPFRCAVQHMPQIGATQRDPAASGRGFQGSRAPQNWHGIDAEGHCQGWLFPRTAREGMVRRLESSAVGRSLKNDRAFGTSPPIFVSLVCRCCVTGPPENPTDPH